MKKFFQKTSELIKLRIKYIKFKSLKRKLNKKNLKYETKKYTYDFQQYETIKSFGESIYTREASIVEAEDD